MPFLAARVGGGASRSCRRPLRYHSDRRRRRGESFLQGVYLRATCCLRAPCGARASRVASLLCVGNFEAFATAIFDQQLPASFYDVQDLRGCTCTHREPPPRAQTPPNTTHRCRDEAVRLRAPERARSRGRGHLGRHGALAASETVKRDDAFAAPSRRRVRRGAVTRAFAGPPAQVQDRAGHADVCVGIKVQAPHVVAVTASARWRGGSRRSTQHLNHGVMSTQAIQQGHRGQEAAPLLPRQET